MFQYKGPDGWEASKDAILRLAKIATQKGAAIVLLQTWAHREGNYDRSNAFFRQLFPDYPTMQRLLITGYEMYKHEIEKVVPGSQVLIAPVGVAWSVIHDTVRSDSRVVGPDIYPGAIDTFKELYVEDDYHPSLKGTMLTALVLAETISKQQNLSTSAPLQQKSSTHEKILIQAQPNLSEPWLQFLQSVALTAVHNDSSYVESWVEQRRASCIEVEDTKEKRELR